MRTAKGHVRRKESGRNPGSGGLFTAYRANPDFVLSAANCLKVMEAFEGHSEGLTAADIARHTGLSRAMVRRLLVTLELLGYTESDGQNYRLTTRVLKLGFSYLSSTPLTSLAQPVLDRLTDTVHESSSIGVLDGDELVYVARSVTKRVMSVSQPVGSRLPAYCTSMGRVLLAALSDQDLAAYMKRVELKALTSKTVTDKKVLGDIIRRVRSDGFALTDEELELGLRSLAVPITASNGRTVAAMNIGVHAARVSSADMFNRLLPILREHAKSLVQFLS